MASVFEQIGGEPAVSAAVDGLYARLLVDTLASLGVPAELIEAGGAKLAPLRAQA